MILSFPPSHSHEISQFNQHFTLSISFFFYRVFFFKFSFIIFLFYNMKFKTKKKHVFRKNSFTFPLCQSIIDHPST